MLFFGFCSFVVMDIISTLCATLTVFSLERHKAPDEANSFFPISKI